MAAASLYVDAQSLSRFLRGARFTGLDALSLLALRKRSMPSISVAITDARIGPTPGGDTNRATAGSSALAASMCFSSSPMSVPSSSSERRSWRSRSPSGAASSSVLEPVQAFPAEQIAQHRLGELALARDDGVLRVRNEPSESARAVSPTGPFDSTLAFQSRLRPEYLVENTIRIEDSNFGIRLQSVRENHDAKLVSAFLDHRSRLLADPLESHRLVNGVHTYAPQQRRPAQRARRKSRQAAASATPVRQNVLHQVGNQLDFPALDCLKRCLVAELRILCV